MTNPLDIEHTTSCGHTWTMRHTACPDCFAEMRQRAVAAEAEVERLRAKTVNISVIHPPIDERVRELNERVTDLYADVTEWHDTAERNKRRAEKAEAEVARLEGLILVWRDAPAGEPGIAAYENLTNEAKRIRAQREEGKPLRAEDLLDGLPRLSTEAEAKAAMGSGQPLVKMREIGK